jgi:hypothetical protein
MSDDNLSGADDSDRREGETGLEDYEYLDEENFDSTEDDLAVIGSMGWLSRSH